MLRFLALVSSVLGKKCAFFGGRSRANRAYFLLVDERRELVGDWPRILRKMRLKWSAIRKAIGVPFVPEKAGA
jgi:hypothetical protein